MRVEGWNCIRLSEGQCFVRVECQESSGESSPEAMAKKDEAPPCGHRSFSIVDNKKDEAPPGGHHSFSIVDRKKKMRRRPADTTAFPLWIIKHGLWFFWQEASGSRKRKAAVAPEGAEADALADDDEVARQKNHVLLSTMEKLWCPQGGASSSFAMASGFDSRELSCHSTGVELQIPNSWIVLCFLVAGPAT